MTFEEYWAGLEKKKGGKITGTLTLTAEQFKKMQKQSFDIGGKHASGLKDAADSLYDRVFGGKGRP
jgi:hypothetical protein